jgi:hypothetical protein
VGSLSLKLWNIYCISVLIDLMSAKRLLTYFLFFVFALVVHLIGLNQIGRTWDEQYKVDTGFVVWENILSADFSLPSWKNIDSEYHPLVSKYIYGFFFRPEPIYLGKTISAQNLSQDEIFQINNGNYIFTGLAGNWYAVPYDFTLPRVASAILNSLAVTITVIFASYLVGVTWGFLAGILMLLTPRFVFLGQLATYESISVFFLCIAALYFYKTLQNPTKLRNYIYVGLLCGLEFATRYNNVYCFLLFAGWLLIHFFVKKQRNVLNLKMLLIPVIAFLVNIVIWPLTWHEFPKYLIESLTQAGSRAGFFSTYYPQHLLITAPIPILIGLALGIFFSIKKRGYWNYVFMWWFFSVLIFFSLLTVGMGSTRYIVVIYPAMAILSAYGYYSILKNKLVYILIPVIFLLIIGQARVFPYYLDYFNEFVGGVSGAANKYEFSWWGEGQKEVGLWINANIPDGSTIGLIVTPKYVFPQLRPGLKLAGFIDEKSDADYIVLSRNNESVMSPNFFKTHKIIYQAKVDSEPLVSLFQRIK